MKIAQISPLYESVPPKLYGGTERVVHYLTEELVALGHEVTLFASGDSSTSARLVYPVKKALRLDDRITDVLAPHYRMMEMIEKEAPDFDIIHNHIDYLYYPVIKRSPHTYLTTLHGRLDLPELKPLYSEFSEIPLVSISDSQRAPLKFANWKATIYHGLPAGILKPVNRPGKYLAFVGRISPEKRVDRAIEVALLAGIPIRIAAKVDKTDQEYHETKIRHLFDHPLVEFVGEINDHEKQEFLGNALGLLYLIDWPEPFGLAMIESMACGTPVVAYSNGSIPEVIDNGITGYIVNSQEDAVTAVSMLEYLDRGKCRQVFEERFSSARMASDYVSVYETMVSKTETINHNFLNDTNHITRNIINDQNAYGIQAAEG
jgi:glycosyltransferase involved in cell wall biosynthesis